MMGTLPSSLVTAEAPPAQLPKIVISQIQTGGSGTGTAGQEFIELYNNSSADVDVTNWCVTYSSASDATVSQVSCLTVPDGNTSLWLEKSSYITFTSPDYEAAALLKGDATFSYTGGMSGVSGHIRVLDSDKQEVDKVGWGAATKPETKASVAPAGGKSLQRKIVLGSMQDTNNNFDDFVSGTPTHTASGLYEVEIITDACSNLDGIQPTIPEGYMIDAQNQCVVIPPADVCGNLAGTQAEIPSGFLKDQAGDCYQDQCLNIEGLQSAVPDRYEANNFVCQHIASEKLIITELLPNPSGDDTGSEYVELYNPNSFSVNLQYYRLRAGVNLDKVYNTPSNTSIAPYSYVVVKSAPSYLTLTNTTSQVQLIDDQGVVIDQTPVYVNADDDMAWALIGDTWQYTNQPTPGSANQPSSSEESTVSATTTQAPCGEGKYRNPLTNRCRSIATDAAVLATCDADEYRNPETNRCRKIILASGLAACDAGEERNLATNRCRSVLAASTSLTPCKEGQERNVTTNRCRNVQGVSTTTEPYAVTTTGVPQSVRIGWIVAGVAALAGIGYGAYEWRSEIGGFLKKLVPGKK